MGRRLIVTIEHDPAVESPSGDDGEWTHSSFLRNHHNRVDPETLFPSDWDYEDGDHPSKAFMEKCKVGLAYFLNYYEHGLCDWSIAGGKSYPDDRWDVSHNSGILVWEHDEDDMGAKTLEDRRTDAAAFLERYTNWCNGQCYQYQIETEEGDEVRSSGFYIGFDDVAEAICDELRPDDTVVFKGEADGMAGYHDWPCPVVKKFLRHPQPEYAI